MAWNQLKATIPQNRRLQKWIRMLLQFYFNLRKEDSIETCPRLKQNHSLSR